MWRPGARDSAASGRAGDGGRADADGVARTAAAWEQLGADLKYMVLSSCAHRVRRIQQPARERPRTGGTYYRSGGDGIS